MPLILMSSSLLTTSSSSWLMIWVFMEINSIVMCSMISKEMKKENEKNNQALMYLVVQLISSIIFLLCVNNANNSSIFMLICMTSLMIKSGVWPLHLWYLKTLSLMKIKHKTMSILMTWQKIIPMMLLPLFAVKTALISMALGSLIAPMVKLKKSSSFKTIMISSSLNNNAWLIFSTMISSLFFMMYLMIYSLSLVLTFNFFKTLKTKSSVKTKEFWETMLTLGNMGGVPPMLMFLGKLMIFSILIQTETPKELLLLMMMMACLFMYHYMWSSSYFLTKMPSKTQLWKKDLSMLPQSILMISMILIWLTMFLGPTLNGFTLME